MELKPYEESDFYIKESRDMTTIVQSMLIAGNYLVFVCVNEKAVLLALNYDCFKIKHLSIYWLLTIHSFFSASDYVYLFLFIVNALNVILHINIELDTTKNYLNELSLKNLTNMKTKYELYLNTKFSRITEVITIYHVLLLVFLLYLYMKLN